ncbi:MAG: SH3 domain-containing protein [Anaerolineae bacterium]|jgi:uncharacterized protein YraI|nr:SH3 domain-containing protein [Anaerolineae bacterium]
MFKWISVFVLFALMSLPVIAQYGPNDPVATVNTGSLNVRSGPGVQYGAITTLPRGFGVLMIGRNEEANWVYIQLTNGITGWVNVNYLYTTYRVSRLPVNNTLGASPIIPTATVTGIFTLYFYAFPDGSASVVGSAQLGQSLELLGRNFNSTWAQVRLDGLTGWVEARYLTATVPVRSLAPSDGSIVAPPAPSTSPRPTASPSQGQARTHVIRRGETLSGIAQRYSVNLYTLAAYNGIYNLDLIYAGQTIYIP